MFDFFWRPTYRQTYRQTYISSPICFVATPKHKKWHFFNFFPVLVPATHMQLESWLTNMQQGNRYIAKLFSLWKKLLLRWLLHQFTFDISFSCVSKEWEWRWHQETPTKDNPSLPVSSPASYNFPVLEFWIFESNKNIVVRIWPLHWFKPTNQPEGKKNEKKMTSHTEISLVTA